MSRRGLRGGARLDEAWTRLAPFGPELDRGAANHGPMLAEALFAMGRPEAIEPAIDGFVARNRARLERARRPARPGAPIDEASEAAALGDPRRLADWHATFAQELASVHWSAVLGHWVPRLAPGLVAGSTHGLIRTGHAAHALAEGGSPARLEELAAALAYWAAHYEELPGRYAGGGPLSPAEAVSRLRPLAPVRNGEPRPICHELRALHGHAPFAEAIGLAYPRAGAPDFLSELIGTFAGIFLQGGEVVAFAHALTAPAAVRDLLEFLEPEGADLLRAHSWQLCAGVLCRYGRRGQTGRVHVSVETLDPEDLIDRAIAHGDVHAVKLTAACLREWRLHRDPRLLAAAHESLRRLRPAA